MADALNAATKYVATHRPGTLKWGPAKDLGSDVVEGVRRIKAGDGPDLIVRTKEKGALTRSLRLRAVRS